MSSPAVRSAVAVRGVTAAGVATLAATVGHATAQQALPSTWIVVLAFVLAAPVCVALAGRRLSIPRLAVAVAVSQAAFHLLLRLEFTGTSPVAATSHRAMPMPMPMTDAVTTTGHELSPWMWVGHVLAAALTVLVLATGERAVVALVALARRPFRALAQLAAPRVAAASRIAEPLGIRLPLLVGGPVRRRGPPALV